MLALLALLGAIWGLRSTGVIADTLGAERINVKFACKYLSVERNVVNSYVHSKKTNGHFIVFLDF